MKLLVVNGVNLNMLGIREPDKYGTASYKDLEDYIKAISKSYNIDVEILQRNYEGAIVEKIQQAYRKFDAIIVNAGAYSHTSIAIMDALQSVSIPTVEVHLTDISKREEFRRFSYISIVAEAMFIGDGFESYKKAIEYFANKA